MSTVQGLVDAARQVFLGNYVPAPVVFHRGMGCRVEDVEGRSHLDLCAGVAVVSVGHSHPTVVAAVAEQAAKLFHISNLFYNPQSIQLALELKRRTPFERFFFCNSGAEANEALIKIARLYHFERGDGSRTEIVSTHSSFHGRTMGALALTGEPKYHEGMGPLMGGVAYVKYNDLAALQTAVGPSTAAVMLEPIQGEGGVVVPDDGYLQGARKICDDAGALLLFDEVQTGYGRTGRFLAQEWSGVVPDACSLAKGIAGGFPLGAAAVTSRLGTALPKGSHGSTFGGNALACAAGLAVLEVFDQEKLVENAHRVGAHLGRHLEALATDQRLAAVVGARGRGLLRGIELAPGVDPGVTLERIREAGVLLSLAGGNILRFSPPLCVRVEEIDEGVTAVQRVLRDPPRAKTGS